MSFGRWYVSQTNNKVLLLKKKLPGFLPTSKTSSLLAYFELVSDYTVALLKIEMLKLGILILSLKSLLCSKLSGVIISFVNI